ncbi:MAG: dihydroorotase [Gemmatimonadetes bacterium]|nr:dihydroorotase [Gemmatimonadota bacterium]
MTDTSTLLLQNGRVIDPANGTNREADVLIQHGRIDRVAPNLPAPPDAHAIDVSGQFVVPGLIDVHVHFRDPGFPEKETIDTGCSAAAAGGFTTVVCMPNTDPPLDSPDGVRDVLKRAASADARLHVVACATAGMAGEALTDTPALLGAGVVGFSDDGLPIESTDLMRELLRRSEEHGFVVCPHVEDFAHTRGGHMHEGDVSRRLGINGMGSEGEAAMVERDIDLVREVGGKLHILHISVRRAIDLVRKAKAEGLGVTSEACPHHFILTDEDVPTLGTAGKMSPPLRSKDDREAVIEGLVDGTIDVISTDHAPHTTEEKLRAFKDAPNGILGLETAVGSTLSELVHTNILNFDRVIDKMTAVPARIYGLDAGTLSEGAPADITVIDLDHEWQIDATTFRSKSSNTPFHGWRYRGRPTATILGGNFTHRIDPQTL